MTDHIIYMDNAATTATRPEVLEAMLPYFTQHYGNPSSIHSVGRDARRAVEKARQQVAAALARSRGRSISPPAAARATTGPSVAPPGRWPQRAGTSSPARSSIMPSCIPASTWKSRAMRSPIYRWMKTVW